MNTECAVCGAEIFDPERKEICVDCEDPTPYCAGCNAKTRAKCDCGPRAEND